MIFWGMVALYFKKRWITGICSILIFLIGFSRVYLGVHYPLDVFTSFLLCGVILWIFKKRGEMKNFLSRKSEIFKLGLIIISSLALYGLVFFFSPQGIPSSWFYGFVSLYTSVSLGWFLKNRFVFWNEEASGLQRIARTLVGLAVLGLALHLYPKAFLTYWFIGFWITLGVPLLFSKIR